MPSLRSLPLVLFLLPPLSLAASQIQLPVDQANSSLRLDLCADPGLGQQCDTDTRPLTGTLTVALDANGAPTQISLRNFDFRAVGNYAFQLRWALGLAGVDASVSNLRLLHSRPGPANGYVPLTPSAFTVPSVPFRAEGNAPYNLTGLACAAVTIPCSSNLNLVDLGENFIQNLTGTAQVANGILTVTLDFTFTTPLDTANPTLGTLSGRALVRASAPVSLSLVPPGAAWKYNDSGVDLGATWSLPGGLFDDGLWPAGEAQLGYGDGDELTVVNFGPDPANKRITTYFRHHFNVTDVLAYSNLALRVLADDGVVVYLNGVEVYRANLPPGEPTFGTFASSSISGAAENAYFVASPPPPLDLLVNGLNTLAAEVHQSDPGSSDLSFDLEFAGNRVFTNSPPTVVITSPTNNASVAEGVTLTFQVTAADSDGVVSRVALYEGPVLVGEDSAAPYTFTRPGLCAGTHVFTARAVDLAGAEGVSAPVVVTVTRPPVPLISAGAVWRYLDTGTNLGTAWRARTFDDGAWASGPAQLGFGDGDEATVVNGGPSTARYITTYFRHTFQVANASLVSSLHLRLLRDDGAVVYLNGAEVHRNNMPAGTITHLTLASTNAGGADELTNFFTATLSAAALTNGANVLAVEVHQVNNTSSDISFDLALSATSTNQLPVVTLVSPTPAADALLPLGSTLDLAATAADADGLVTRVEFHAGTNRLGQDTTAPYTLRWADVPAGYHVLTARAFDGCGAMRSSTPVPVRVGTVGLVAPGSLWRYLDTGTNAGTAWRAPGYNDTGWNQGNAQCGYGEGDEVTLVNGGPSTNRFITTYFRHAFVVSQPQTLTGLVVRLLRDDGAAVYLNGSELLRSNLPEGPLTHLTLAPLAVGGADETTFFVTDLLADALVAGTNVLAVELHQQSGTSSDLSFDLELIGLTSVAPPRLQILSGPPNLVLRWPSSAGAARLQVGSDPSPGGLWQYVGGAPTDDGTWRTQAVPASASVQFFRLAP